MMQFETRRLTVGPISAGQKEHLIDLLTDGLVGQTYMIPEFTDREEARPLAERLMGLSREAGRYMAGIFLEGRLIGIIHETEVRDRTVEVGYALLPEFHGRGFAAEALTGAVDWLLCCGFEEVIAGAFAENAASFRVMEKSGMKELDRKDEVEYRGRVHTCLYRGVRKEDRA